ncbi:MAG: ATP-dependent RecD-like DNA helicase [Candidatus Sumerlaeia bacterium]|nr:ATP-dependent RecD-like DNA helicase [Candidatus Sumerlaeia bacterium]
MPPFRKPQPQRPNPEDLPLKRMEFEGVLEKLYFQNTETHFVVAKFQAVDWPIPFTVKGSLSNVVPGERLKIVGEWREDPRYGWDFRIERYVPVTDLGEAGLIAYLGSGMIKGIGPVYAKKIVDAFGTGTLEVLNNHPERLLEVPKLGKAKAELVARVWAEHSAQNEAMVFLQEHGITPALCRRLIRQYGNDTISVLRGNPYRVSMDVSGVGFEKADQLARKFGIEVDSPERVLAGINHLLLRASSEGHTYVPRESLIQSAVELLAIDPQRVEEVVEKELHSSSRFQRFVLQSGQHAVALKNLYWAETGVARLVLNLLKYAQPLLPKGVQEKLTEFEATYRFKLAGEQREAIRSILTTGGVGVITGGPGTGKTTLVRALLWCLKSTEHKVALCSPTGRAAQRLAETTGTFALTIHRMLKYNPHERGFVHNAENPLPINLLIVDEASMLDVPLAYQLLKAITPGTTVLFVGDVDQLPSVGPGALLLDLIESQRPTVTRLNVIFRQASQSAIIQNSHRINRGAMPELQTTTGGQGKTLPDFFFIAREEADALLDSLVELVTKRIPQKFHYDPLRDVQILTPMRRGTLGTEALNGLLQKHLNPQSLGTPIGSLSLRVGDKVIQTTNNYDLDVYNGDIGYVESISRDALTFTVTFGKRTVEYTFGEADQLQLAYAITIHKSQGSEYPVCIILLHPQHFTLLQRNLLYTAVTRGKKLVLLLGTQKAVQMAVHNHQLKPRLTGLREWLHYPPEKSAEETPGSLFEVGE